MRESRPSSHIGLYRAGITGPEHRRCITVGRESYLQDTLEILRTGIGKKPKHHFLFIGPRGIGKTHLLSLLEDEVGRDQELAASYHVVRFSEESHRVLSFGDFLLRVCEILRDTMPTESKWGELYQRLSTEERDEIIIDTLVPAIRNRRREHSQSLIIMLENLNQVFEQQMKDVRQLAALRGFLMENNGCLLIATAPLHFGSITEHSEPFYDFFDIQVLDQLSEEQTIELIRKNLEWEQRDDLLANFTNLRPRLLALYRMTGGSPRLTLMLYELIAHEAVSEVKRQFEILLDRITPFYQDRMRDLGPQERAVLETIAMMRDQAKTPTAIAARMRMKISQLSSLLNRLSKAQYLKSVENPDDKRSRFYTIREGFFDVWLAMNVSRGARQRLPFLVEFFAQFYPSIEERNRKRHEYRERLARGEFDAPKTAIAAEDLRAGLDCLSEVGTEEERAQEKLLMAGMYVREGNAEQAKSYLSEVRSIPLDHMGTWIVRRAEFEPELDYLTEVEDLIHCWDSLRSGNLESFAEKVKSLGEGLTFQTWSESKIAFLKEHLALLPEEKDRVEMRLRIGNVLRTLARWSDAETELNLAVEEAIKLDDPELQAWAMNDLAVLLQDTNRQSEAEPLLRRALAIDEQISGSDHPSVARDLNNLAILLHDTNRLAEVEPLICRALAITEKSYGSQHPDVAMHLNNLARLLLETNRQSEAEALMRRALSIDEQSYGNEHPDVAFDLNNLALLVQSMNRLEEAEPLMRRALSINEQSIGGEHPHVARQINNLATLLLATKRFSEAEPLIRRALSIHEQSYGAEHPEVATDLNNLALLHQATNRLEEAEPFLWRAVEIFIAFEKSTGHEHPNMRATIANYAQLLQAMGLSEDEANAKIQAKLQDEKP
jgi:tetratricopeptide (TPR) repeat protein